MDIISITLIIVGIISILMVYRLFSGILSEIHNKKVLKNIIKRDSIRRDILNHTCADSVTFWKTHNKDGKASHTKDYKTTCVRGTKEEENTYRGLVVDEDFVEILNSLMSKDKIYYSFRTHNEKPCLLKTIFDREGISVAAIFYIKSTPSGIFYAIFSKKEDTQFSDGDIYKFIEAVKKVKTLNNIYNNF